MFIFFVLGGLATVGLVSFIRYRSICQSESKQIQNQKSIFEPYDIGAMLYTARDQIHNSSEPREDKEPSFAPHQKQISQNEQNQLTGHDEKNDQQEDLKSSKDKRQALPLSVALADSGLHGADAFHQVLAIDDNIYAGVERMSNETMDSFSDLSAKLKTYSHDDNGLTKGALSNLKGHVAEQHVADHFEQAGIKVDWPDASNQKGWDLLLEGHEVNSKLIKDTSSLTEHFQKYPDIPVVIPSDAEGIPDHAFYFDPSQGKDALLEYLDNSPEKAVIVNTELSNEALTSSVKESANEAIDGIDMGPSVPYITLAFSGYREFQLLQKGDTDITTSLKNIGLDGAGIAGGASAGGAIGAGIGSIVPGIGTAIGGIAGSLIGGLVGRAISDDIKNSALNEALEKLKQQTAIFKKRQAYMDQKVKKQMAQAIKDEQVLLNDLAKQSKAKINVEVKQLREWNVQIEKSLIELKQKLLKELEGQVSAWSWMDVLWPRRAVIAYKLRSHQIRAFIDEVRGQTFKDRGQLLQKFADQGLCRQSVLLEIKAVEQQKHIRNEDLTDRIKHLEKSILEQRQESMQKVSEKLKACILQIREELAPFIKKIQKCQKALVREGKKLGKNFDAQADAA